MLQAHSRRQGRSPPLWRWLRPLVPPLLCRRLHLSLQGARWAVFALLLLPAFDSWCNQWVQKRSIPLEERKYQAIGATGQAVHCRLCKGPNHCKSIIHKSTLSTNSDVPTYVATLKQVNNSATTSASLNRVPQASSKGSIDKKFNDVMYGLGECPKGSPMQTRVHILWCESGMQKLYMSRHQWLCYYVTAAGLALTLNSEQDF